MSGGCTYELPVANSIVEFKARAYRMQPVMYKGYGLRSCKGCAFDNGSPDCMSAPPCVSDLGANLIFTPVLPALA